MEGMFSINELAEKTGQSVKRLRFIVMKLGIKPVRTIGTTKLFSVVYEAEIVAEAENITRKKKDAQSRQIWVRSLACRLLTAQKHGRGTTITKGQVCELLRMNSVQALIREVQTEVEGDDNKTTSI